MAQDARIPPQFAFVMELRVRVDPPLEIGPVAGGQRRIVPIRGGTFSGPLLRGAVLDGGADWQLIRDDGVAELDTRYTLRTDQDELIHIRNAGVRHAPPAIMQKLLAGEAVDPSLVYFRTVPRFETSAPRLQWLTRAIFIGDAERHPDLVVVRVWQVE